MTLISDAVGLQAAVSGEETFRKCFAADITETNAANTQRNMSLRTFQQLCNFNTEHLHSSWRTVRSLDIV